MDTAAKRFSAINHGSPWRGIAVLPDGTIGQADRQAVAYLYSGILAATPVALVNGPICFLNATIYHPGAKAADVYRPGGQETAVYHPGGKAAKVT